MKKYLKITTRNNDFQNDTPQFWILLFSRGMIWKHFTLFHQKVYG
jgi:hypothetical protein